MGISDDFLKPRYKDYLKNNLTEFENLKIAWLGQQDPNYHKSTNLDMFEYLSGLFENCEHHFYDILNEKTWDVHSGWDEIKGYDLVLCLRLTYLVQSSSHLLSEMKKATEGNGLFVGDFVSGNLTGDTMSWKTDNLVCFLPEYYIHTSERSLKYKVSDIDHLLTKQMLDDSLLKLVDHASFQDLKGRHYIIGKVMKNES